MDLADVERFLQGFDTVECCFPDMWGIFVGRRMPSSAFWRAVERGLSMPNAPLAWNVLGDIDPVPYANPDTGYPNMHVVPDLDTLRAAPWADRTAFCLMDAWEAPGGAPSPLATRTILRRAEASLGDLGFEAWVAPELEFYLCTADGRPLYDDHRCWSMTRGAEFEHVIGEIRDLLLRCDIPIESSQTEGGPGQWEINIGPASGVRTADAAAILRYVAKIVARRHGLMATFMPMPFQDVEGSGFHLHASLRSFGSDENVFAETSEQGELPAVMGLFLAGVLEHMGDLTAVNLPSINAYKRLKDYTFAPNRVCWAFDNRTVAVRIPSGDTSARRLEIRSASADANPYLVVAAAIASGADGIQRSSSPPPPIEGDAYKDDRLEQLPSGLGTAVERFERSAFCKDVFGAVFVETYALLARREEDAFRWHVTDWERSRYLGAT